MKRATLADFTDADAGADDDRSSTDEDGANDVDTECTDTRRSADRPGESVDRPATTFASGRERPCASCGARTVRQWRTDDGFVCPSCVVW